MGKLSKPNFYSEEDMQDYIMEIRVLAHKYGAQGKDVYDGLYSEEFLQEVAELQKDFDFTVNKIRMDVQDAIYDNNKASIRPRERVM